MRELFWSFRLCVWGGTRERRCKDGHMLKLDVLAACESPGSCGQILEVQTHTHTDNGWERYEYLITLNRYHYL